MTTAASASVSSAFPPSVRPPASAARDVAAQFEGLLFARALAPIAASCGFLGDAVVGMTATDLARRDGGALGAALERSIDAASADGASR